MIGELNIEKVEESGKIRYILSGKIDESSDYSSIDRTKNQRIILDFRNVSLINSSGIQKWVQFIKSIPSSSTVDFDECPLRIINQMNLFPGFMGDRKIIPLSFYAPYYCEKCDVSKNIRLNTTQYFASGDLKAPEQNCTDCGQLMEFDGIEKKYFVFLQRAA